MVIRLIKKVLKVLAYMSLFIFLFIMYANWMMNPHLKELVELERMEKNANK